MASNDRSRELSTGKMSLGYAGLTLACAQIGSALVAVPSFMQKTLIFPGVVILCALGVTVLLATYHLQQLWLHMRKEQLSPDRERKREGERKTIRSMSRSVTLQTPLVANDRDLDSMTHIGYSSLLEFTMREQFPRFAKCARRWTLLMQIIALGGTAVSEIIQVGSSLYIATGLRLTPQLWALIVGLGVMTPLTWIPDYKRLERFSMIAVLAIVFTAATVCAAGAGALGGGDLYHRCEPEDFKFSSFFVGTSGFVFIWGGLALVPEVQSSMANPQHLTRAMVLNVLFCCAVAVPTGLYGLNLCHTNDTSSVELPLPGNVLIQLPWGAWRSAAAACLSAHMVIAYAVLLIPLMEVFENGFNPPLTTARWVTSRTGWSLLTMVIGLAFPFFGDLVAVVAAVAQVYLSFIAPPVLFIAVFRNELKQSCLGTLQLVLAGTMALVMFVFGTGFGVYASMYEITQNIRLWGVFQAVYGGPYHD